MLLLRKKQLRNVPPRSMRPHKGPPRNARLRLGRLRNVQLRSEPPHRRGQLRVKLQRATPETDLPPLETPPTTRLAAER